jgi:hypothetical protein
MPTELTPEKKDTSVRLILFFILVLFTGVILYAHHIVTSRQVSSPVSPVTKYSNYVYKINLEYPSDWQATAGYNYDHYDGTTGFFSLSATGDVKTTLDDLVKRDLASPSQEYGSNPSVIDITVDGQEARLITPSADQNALLKGQAELIVAYPIPAIISLQAYPFLVLLADKDHIKDIITSLSFIRS